MTTPTSSLNELIRSPCAGATALMMAAAAVAGCSGDAAGGGSGRSTPAEVEAAATSAAAGKPNIAPPPDLGPPKRIYAKRYVAKVREAADREAERIGYLRAGSTLMATSSRPIGFEGCRGGWYELTTGGFVCNGRSVIAFDGERLPERPPAVPDREAKLPYRYAVNRKAKVAVYRRLPTDEEAVEFEGYVIPGTEPKPAAEPEGDGAGTDDAAPDGEATDAAAGAEGSGRSTASAEGDARSGAGEQATAAPEMATGEGGAGDAARRAGGGRPAAPDDVEAHAAAVAPPGVVTDPDAYDEEDLEEEEIDAGPPTLADLAVDDDESVLLRWMLKGFYVSLDRDFRIGRRRYWRTLSNEYIPHKALYEVEGSDFEGTVLDADEGWFLPLGYLLSSRDHAYRVDGRGRLRRDGEPGYHHVFRVVGQETHRGRTYFVAPDGRRYRADETTLIERRERPSEIPPGVKWVDVDLGRQSLVAWDGDTPVFATLVSTGRVKQPDDPEQDHETPSGVFQVTSKHLTGMMDGDNAIDGPYSIEDVPYIMYFELAYAFHTAFWHNRFGRTKSHGCVNMSPRDARRLFEWADPPLPAGWHGVYPTEDNPGTWVWIHGTTPEG